MIILDEIEGYEYVVIFLENIVGMPDEDEV